MAEYYDYHDDGARGVGTVGLIRIAGAVSSIALVIGLGMWGYKIAVRDVMGIPVVRALEGAMRVAPAAPGGTVADHQGLAVNDVAALGVATPLPDSLTLAPRPVELAADDPAGLVAGEETAGLVVASAEMADPAALLLPQNEPAVEEQARADVGAAAPASLAPVEVEVAAPGPVPEDAIAAALAEALAAPEAAAPATTTQAPATMTLRPQRRPDGLVAAAAAPPVSAPAVTDTQEVATVTSAAADPATLTVGMPLVQLGAFDTGEDAQAAWATLAGQFPDLADHAMVVQPATSGGQTFYRLRASGFESEDMSRKFCTVLLAANVPCIPVAHR
jgi:SPOR domain